MKVPCDSWDVHYIVDISWNWDSIFAQILQHIENSLWEKNVFLQNYFTRIKIMLLAPATTTALPAAAEDLWIVEGCQQRERQFCLSMWPQKGYPGSSRQAKMEAHANRTKRTQCVKWFWRIMGKGIWEDKREEWEGRNL